MITFAQRSVIALLCRVILGVILVYASIDKIVHPEEFAKSIGNYNVLPFGLENLLGIILPVLELLVGSCLILGIMLDGSAIITAGMMTVFIIALSQAMIRGIDINCGCFKVTVENGGHQVGIRRIIEDFLFLGMSIMILSRGQRKWELYPKS
tara:strand:- start:30 stop:485 length:456 start_codon:yes stop_codon:yes gene_type:complete